MVDGELIKCELSDGGRLCVRAHGGGLTPMEDFLQNRGRTAIHGRFEGHYVGIPPTSPGLPPRSPGPTTRSTRRSLSPASRTASRAASRMQALVTPIAIGGAGSFLVA